MNKQMIEYLDVATDARYDGYNYPFFFIVGRLFWGGFFFNRRFSHLCFFIFIHVFFFNFFLLPFFFSLSIFLFKVNDRPAGLLVS